jgi:hypothetical protein
MIFPIIFENTEISETGLYFPTFVSNLSLLQFLAGRENIQLRMTDLLYMSKHSCYIKNKLRGP